MFCGVYVVSFFYSLYYMDWFLIWCGLEMNMMSFLGMSYSRKSGGEIESLYKYFFIQSIASGGFLVMLLIGGYVSVMLMVKLAVGPFYFWFPSVMSGLSWTSNFLLMTFQKVLPLTLMSGLGGKDVFFPSLIGMVVGVLGSFNQACIIKLLAYSSVSHVSWMLLSQVICGWNLWFFYLVIYTLMMAFIVNFLMKKEKKVLNFVSSMDYIMFVFLMMNMGGLPPFLGFVMKWMVLRDVVEIDLLVGIFLILTSVFMIYVYFRVVYDGILGGGKSMGWMNLGDSMNFLMLIILGSFFLPLFVWTVGM